MANNTIRPGSRTPVVPRSTERRETRSTETESSPIDMFSAFNPMTYWTNVIGASMAMWSPLGYGAMRGPLGY